MTESKWVQFIDEKGIWKDFGSHKILLEPSQEWIEKQREIEEHIFTEPSQEEINVEFDYRLCLVELGLQ